MHATTVVLTTNGSRLTTTGNVLVTHASVAAGNQNPAAGAMYTPAVSATALTGTTQYIPNSDVLVSTSIARNNTFFRVTISKKLKGSWISQVGIYSDATLIAILVVPAFVMGDSDVYIRGAISVAPEKFATTINKGPILSVAKRDGEIQKLLSSVSKQFPVGVAGSTYFYNPVTKATEAKKIVAIMPLYQTTEQVEAEKRRGSGSDIFNNWRRFSHANNWNQPALAAEVSAWTYRAATDSVVCTLNSESYIGFVSPKTYDEYELDVLLSSTDNDDDDIGVVLAFTVDADGKERTLSVIRSPGGFGHCFSLISDYKRPNEVVHHRSTAIKWGNGNYGATGAAAGFTANQTYGRWSAKGNVRVKVTRKGSIFTIQSSDFGTPDVLVPNSLFTFDVSKVSGMSVFAEKASYGFSALSQNASTFKVSSFTDESSLIIDLQTLKTWSKVNGAWVSTSYKSATELVNQVGPGRLVFNPETGHTFQVSNDSIVRIF